MLYALLLEEHISTHAITKIYQITSFLIDLDQKRIKKNRDCKEDAGGFKDQQRDSIVAKHFSFRYFLNSIEISFG